MTDLLLRLSPRERLLLGVLLLVIAPIALWIGVLEPLKVQRDGLDAELQDARALRAWVDDRTAEAAALQVLETRGPTTPIGLAGLEQSLISADLRTSLSDLSNGPEGEVTARFDRVPFVALMEWMTRSESTWGYTIVSIRINRSPDAGYVQAQLQLRPM